MKKTLLSILLLSIWCTLASAAATSQPEAPLRLGIQAWTYNNKTFVETLEEVERLGVKNLQAFPGQKLGGDYHPNGKFHHNMSSGARKSVLELAKKHGIKLTSYGVVYANGEEEWRKVFDFAKDMEMEDIAIEPDLKDWPTQLPIVMKLSAQTGIGFGFHNHPNTITPEQFIARMDAISPSLGLFADTGHWARSGWDPVQALRTSEGRLVGVHLKDLNQRARHGSHDVPWGTGSSDMAQQIAELRRQGYKGVAYIEYEHRTPNLPKEVELSAEYFARTQNASDSDLLASKVTPPNYTSAAKAGSIEPKADAGRWGEAAPLFTADLSNAVFTPGSWSWKDGILTGDGKGNLLTRTNWRNFSVSMEFRCDEGAQSAVLLRVPDGEADRALKIIIRQGDAAAARQGTASLADCLEPTRAVTIEPGQWYRYVIAVRDNWVAVRLNGEHLLNVDLNRWKDAGKNPDGTPNPYPAALKDLPRGGAVGLLAPKPAGGVQFRKLSIESI